MFNSLSKVNEEFFKVFNNIEITVDGGVVVAVPFVYARKSGKDFVESETVKYPCITVYDHVPTVKPEWFIDYKEYSDGISLDGTQARVYRRPVWMEFSYDVSIASKSYFEITALKELFTRKFLFETYLLLDKRLTGDNEVGEVIPIKVSPTDIPRMDGVQEVNYEFKLSVWVDLHEPKEVDVITNIILKASEV
jgi:hypothetical protein